LTIEWAGGGRDVRVLGTFTQKQQLPLKKMYVLHRKRLIIVEIFSRLRSMQNQADIDFGFL
jgi:hypothetical protein